MSKSKPGTQILETNPEYTIMVTDLKIRCNRCEMTFESPYLPALKLWLMGHNMEYHKDAAV